MTRSANSGNVSPTTVIVCLTSILVVSIGAVVAVLVASPDTTDALARAGIITGFVGIFLPQMLVLVRQDRVQGTVEAIDEKTDQVLNGGMDRKLQAAIHTALDARGVGKPPKTRPKSV